MLYRGFKRRKKLKLVSDINITPFVDVLLVLLIIFMVAAPMMTSSVIIDLPEGANSEQIQKKEPIFISIKSNEVIYLNDDQVSANDLGQKLQDNNLQTDIIGIRGDKGVKYGKIMDVVKIVNKAGFNNISLVTETEF